MFIDKHDLCLLVRCRMSFIACIATTLLGDCSILVLNDETVSRNNYRNSFSYYSASNIV